MSFLVILLSAAVVAAAHLSEYVQPLESIQWDIRLPISTGSEGGGNVFPA